MKRTILYNGKHYELVHWHFRYLEAKDEFGNKLLIKHSQNKRNLISILKNLTNIMRHKTSKLSLTKSFFILIVIISMLSCDESDPYSEGLHWDYSIRYENGFVYKNYGRNGGTIIILNSDGTPLKAGHKIY